MHNLDPILQVLLSDLLHLAGIIISFTLVGVIPALLIAMGAGAANEHPSRWRDVPSGAFWGLLAGVPAWVATYLILLSVFQIAGAVSNHDIVAALMVGSAAAGVPAAYHASAWYFRRKAQQLFSWAIETPPTPPQPANHWYSFSLQRLFVAQFVLIFVLALWVGARREHIAWVYQQRREAAEWSATKERLATRFGVHGWRVWHHRKELWLHQPDGMNLVKFSDEILARLEPADQLWQIEVRSDALTDVGLEYLSRNPTIRKLEIESKQVTDLGISHVRKMTSLEEIKLTCPSLTARSLDELQTLKSLKKVTLYKSTIPWQRVNEFKQARPEVRIIVLP
jgi:hypothetical protein